MSRTDQLLKRLDKLQARVPWLGFPIAVLRKFAEDQASNYASLIAYYGFLSLFPLLLVAISVLQILIQHNPTLQNQIVTTLLKDFPVVGEQLRSSLHAASGSLASTIFGLAVTFIGARGTASVMQDALNRLWSVPYIKRPGFGSTFLRTSVAMIVLGVGATLATSLTSIAQWWSVPLALLVNMGLFLSIFRLSLSSVISTRNLIPGAVIAAGFWEILLITGGLLVSHQLSHLSSIYGAFAVVFGLLWWLYLQALVTVLAVEIDVVRTRKLWPRSLMEPPTLPGDREAYTQYAHTEQRRPEQDIDVRFRRRG